VKIKNCFQVTGYRNAVSIGLLLVRLVMGAAFVLHGWGKLNSPGGPIGWMGPEAPVPAFLQLLAALSEFGGGLALILGLLVPLAMLGLTATMLVATSMHMFVMKDPFLSPGPGQGAYELPLLYLALSLMFLLAGPGKFSLDAKLFGSR
jgi:putative oxidoreductase